MPPFAAQFILPYDRAEFGSIQETWRIIHRDYVDQPIDDEALSRGAIRGMMTGLQDKYSMYLTAQEYSQVQASLSGEFTGYGITVDMRGDYLIITRVIPDSPAEQAGLLVGDQIIAINGEPMPKNDPNYAMQVIQDPSTQKTILLLLRASDEQISVDVSRADLHVKSVECSELGDGVYLLRIDNFGSETYSELHSILEDLVPHQPNGLVVDVRDNGGGYLTASVDVLSEFLPTNSIVLYEMDMYGARNPVATERAGLAVGIPVVVLVNQSSASAAEIFAGAIQDLQRGAIVGEKTYGKGSVQAFRPLPNGGMIRITIAHWLTPSGRSIHVHGIDPDVLISITPGDLIQGKDPQLEYALGWIRSHR